MNLHLHKLIVLPSTGPERVLNVAQNLYVKQHCMLFYLRLILILNNLEAGKAVL